MENEMMSSTLTGGVHETVSDVGCCSRHPTLVGASGASLLLFTRSRAVPIA